MPDYFESGMFLIQPAWHRKGNVVEDWPGDWETTRKGAFTQEQLDESRRYIRWMIAKMEEALTHSKWLAGKSYSLADINTYPQVEGVTRLYKEFWSEKNAPRSIEWLARINERPAVKTMYATGPGRPASHAQAMAEEKPARARA